MLPIYDIQDRLVAALRDSNRLVLEAPTGSGKSTQVPQMLVDQQLLGDHGEVVVLQPRRVAARMLARRVAQERGGRVGEEVGYQVRFENHVSRNTRIRYVTEGVLLRQILDDPDLRGVSAVIFDEFHERHFFGDITLARALKIQRDTRPDLKLLVMSATLDGERIADYLGGCPRLSSEGRTFPVDIRYAPMRERQKGEIWDHIVRIYADHLKSSGDTGDALIFLPGAYEIRKTTDAFRRHSWARHIDILPLYGELSPREQDRAVNPGDKPKIVVATNVAETSLTIDGVRLVIDSGLARMANFDTRRGIDTLTIQKISQASADQRAGRAGRTAAGICIRIWSEDDHARRPSHTPPEIHRMDLAEVILTLKVSGVDDIDAFEWFEKPDEAGLQRAQQLLVDLGALERGSGAVTQLGRQLARFPVTPRYARVLAEAQQLGCFDEMVEIVAMTQGKPIFVRNKQRGSDLTRDDFVDPNDESDFESMLRALSSARDFKFDAQRLAPLGIHAGAAREADRLAKLLRSRANTRGQQRSSADIARCLLTGFPDQVARRLNRSNRACEVVGGRRGRLGDESCVDAELLVAVEIAEIEGREVNVLLNLNTIVTRDLLEELFPNDFHTGASAEWDPRERRVQALDAVRFRDLTLESKPSKNPNQAQAAEILAREVVAGNLVLKKWDRAVEQWIARLSTLATAMPELELPLFGDDDKLAVIEQICFGALSYKQIKDREVWPELKKFLAPHQRPMLDQLVPHHIDLPNGRRARIRYEMSAKPVLSARLQHLYDINKTPSLANGRIPLRIEILAPNQRPVQITEDLPGFWANSYEQVKKDLKGRYPKHEWR